MVTKERMPPPPKEAGEAKWATRSQAKQEEKNWSDLEKAKQTADVWWTWRYGSVIIVLLLVFAALFIGSLASWSLHYILPNKCHWLTPEQLSKIQSVIFSGSLGGVVSLVAQKQLSK